MINTKFGKYNILILFIVLFLSFLSFAYLENTNFFAIDTSYVGIQDGNIDLQGLLYKPASVSSSNPAPGIVLAHGIANSKEVVSGYALELAKRGFVALALDEVAHGNSGGNLLTARTNDPSLGVSSAVNWLQKQNFILNNSIGVIGHSMGAGAVLSASLNSGTIKSTILIGGGVNGTLTESSGMNDTTPNNLLIIIGQFDVLFNIPQLKSDSGLQSVFNTSSEIQEDTLYGSFSDSTARELYTIPATHLFEVENPDAIATITDWLSKSLDFTPNNQNGDYSSFFLRDISLICSFICFVILVLLFSRILIQKLNLKKKDLSLEFQQISRGNYLLLGLSWSILSLILFMPSQIIGSIIIFPPLIFGSFFAFWHLLTAIGAFLILVLYKKRKYISYNLKLFLKSVIDNKEFILFAIGVFAGIYIITVFIEEFLHLNFKLFIPVLNEIGSADRIIIFFMILPYTLLFFFFQNIYYYYLSDYKDYSSKTTLLLQITLLEGPFIVILAIFYLPIFLASIVLIKGTTGFFTEFLVPTTAVFIITTVINWFFYRETENITIGTVLNALLVALTISSLFPVVQTFF